MLHFNFAAISKMLHFKNVAILESLKITFLFFSLVTSLRRRFKTCDVVFSPYGYKIFYIFRDINSKCFGKVQ